MKTSLTTKECFEIIVDTIKSYKFMFSIPHIARELITVIIHILILFLVSVPVIFILSTASCLYSTSILLMLIVTIGLIAIWLVFCKNVTVLGYKIIENLEKRIWEED